MGGARTEARYATASTLSWRWARPCWRLEAVRSRRSSTILEEAARRRTWRRGRTLWPCGTPDGSYARYYHLKEKGLYTKSARESEEGNRSPGAAIPVILVVLISISISLIYYRQETSTLRVGSLPKHFSRTVAVRRGGLFL